MGELSVFISYSRIDANFAWDVALTLRELNINVWMDQLDIAPGEHWDRAIHAALKNCTHLLVIHSQASFTSNNVWDEWSYFLNRRKPVVPLIIETVELPFRLERVQYIDFVHLPFKRAIDQLLNILLPHNRELLETDTVEMHTFPELDDLDITQEAHPDRWQDRSGNDHMYDDTSTQHLARRGGRRNRYGKR